MSKPDLKELQEAIVEDFPRFTKDDRFRFACHPGVPCFNRCCSDVNIFLTPYDILRLKQRLGITSTEFLANYALFPFKKEQKLPLVQFKMREEGKSCHFLSEQGCTVYEDRPWACRMYPVGLASRQHQQSQEKFYFVLEEDHCEGHKEDREWSIAEWMQDQGVEEYEKMNEAFQEVTNLAYQWKEELDPKQMEMFFMSTYDLDRFGAFVFESTFLERFEVPPSRVEKIRNREEELLLFAMDWLKFSLFRQPTLNVRSPS